MGKRQVKMVKGFNEHKIKYKYKCLYILLWFVWTQRAHNENIWRQANYENCETTIVKRQIIASEKNAAKTKTQSKQGKSPIQTGKTHSVTICDSIWITYINVYIYIYLYTLQRRNANRTMTNQRFWNLRDMGLKHVRLVANLVHCLLLVLLLQA